MKLNIPYKSGTVRVSSPYGMRTLNGTTAMHKGVDLVGTVKTIISPCAGKIGWAGEYDDRLSGGRTWEWGKYVRIETDDGYMVYLCHLAAVFCQAGMHVEAGDEIGTEGSTGYSTGNHLHMEVRKNGESLDPTPLLGIANRVGSYPAESDADRVCRKAGLETQTKNYINRYPYAAYLWRKLCEAMR